MIEEFVSKLITSFLSFDKKSKKNYDDFVCFFHLSMKNMIDSTKSISTKNKYNRIEKDVLNYFGTNRKKIISELEKKSNK